MSEETERGKDLLITLFKEGLNEPLPDDEVLSFILQSTDDTEALQEALLSFSTNFGSLTVDNQLALVNQFCENLNKTTDADSDNTAACSSKNNTIEQQRDPSQKPAAQASALAEAFSRLNTQSGGSESDSSGDTTRSSSSHKNNKPPTPEEQTSIATLHALVPDNCSISQEFLLHILRERCGGSVESAAIWLTDSQVDVVFEQQTWHVAEQKRQEELAAEAAKAEALKKQMVDRFALQAVSDRPAVPVMINAKKGSQQESKIRYRDGVVVSSKGEKYIVEKLTEEWDGGSRGRVKSKRKGGVGWH